MEAPDNVSATIQDPIELQHLAASIQRLLESGMAPEALTRISRLRSRDQADVVSQLSGEAPLELLERLAPNTAGPLVEQLDRAAALKICRHLKPEHLAPILDHASPDAAADVLKGLPAALASLTIERMTEADGVTRLLDYEDDEAGGLMTPEFIALRHSMTVTQALAFVRRRAANLDRLWRAPWLWQPSSRNRGTGRIAGTQTLTVIVRSMALGDIGSGNVRRLLSKEVRIGLVHGLALGVLVGIVAWLWQGNVYLALVVGVATAVNLVIAAAAGALVPLGFRALRIDPALSSWWSEPSEFGIVYSDSSVIEHAVTNLIDNAVKFAAGQVEVRITKNPTQRLGRRTRDRCPVPAAHLRPGLDARGSQTRGAVQLGTRTLYRPNACAGIRRRYDSGEHSGAGARTPHHLSAEPPFRGAAVTRP